MWRILQQFSFVWSEEIIKKSVRESILLDFLYNILEESKSRMIEKAGSNVQWCSSYETFADSLKEAFFTVTKFDKRIPGTEDYFTFLSQYCIWRTTGKLKIYSENCPYLKVQ